MTDKISALKEGLSEVMKLCLEIPGLSLQTAIEAINQEVEGLRSDDDVELGLSLLSELLMHVNDLDEEFAESYEDAIAEINDLAEDLRSDANSA